MKSNRLIRLILGFSVLGFMVAICTASVAAFWLALKAISGPAVAEDEPLSNRIVFVGNDGNLWLAAPDNSALQHITGDARGYRFPTWAPDGRHLAFMGPDDEGTATLYISNQSHDGPTVLFGKPDSVPFYIYWSPDSRSVSFLTQEVSSLAMRLVDVESPRVDRVMAEGAPFYWTWSPAGDRLLMHVGGSRAASQDAHLSFLDKKAGARRVELKLAPGRFQAPVWSTGGQYVFYVAAYDSEAEAIYKTDVETGGQTLITPVEEVTYIVLAPNDENIAYLLVRAADRLPASGTAYVIDTMGANKRLVMEDWVAAMYWSPDAKKLAVLTLAQGGESPIARVRGLAAPLSQLGRFRWWVYDVEMETLELLVSFVPTVEFLQTVPFFDQYHLSLTFWSPDSRYFVVTKGNVDDESGTVWVLDVIGEEAPRQIGEGTFAVWSWQ